MKVILRDDVENLGRAGDVKEVSAGYGRNFLVPKRLAQAATPGALRGWEKSRDKRAKLGLARVKQAQELAAKLGGVSLSFTRPAGAEGKLFGSIGKSDILKSLKSCGYELEKETVRLEASIKTAGEHEVELKLLPEVSARIKVTVAARD